MSEIFSTDFVLKWRSFDHVISTWNPFYLAWMGLITKAAAPVLYDSSVSYPLEVYRT